MRTCKVKLISAAVVIAAGLLFFAGCKLFGPEPSAPSALESRLYDIQTNWVEKVVTNTIFATNVQFQTLTVTNSEKHVEVLVVTNLVPVAIPQVVTNLNAEYFYKASANAEALKAAAGKVAGLSGIPGADAIGTAIVGGAIYLWGFLRSSRKNKVAGALAQGIEVAREVIAAHPQGEQLEEAYRKWLVEHQAQLGVYNDVSKMLPKVVSNPAAVAAMDEIFSKLTTPPAPRPTIPSAPPVGVSI